MVFHPFSSPPKRKKIVLQNCNTAGKSRSSMKMSFDLAGPVVHSGGEFTFRGLTMKKFLLAGVAALALGAAGSANAADLGRPVYKAPPVAVPVPVRVFSWTGCYVGGNIGGAWGRKDFSSAAPSLFFFDEVP